MNSNIDLEIIKEALGKAPESFRVLLDDKNDALIHTNEGEGTWSPYEIIQHLIFAEKNLWPVRIQLILSDKPDKCFKPFDRFGHLHEGKTKLIRELLLEFDELRNGNLNLMASLKLDQVKLGKTGVHPEFGEISLSQLLYTWMVHDWSHQIQTTRVLAKQFQSAIGPWVSYLSLFR